jgi:hypothetical protein
MRAPPDDRNADGAVRGAAAVEKGVRVKHSSDSEFLSASQQLIEFNYHLDACDHMAAWREIGGAP